VHGGKKVAYLDYFRNAQPHQIILDQLQSEQGARFLRKRNRNIIIKVDEEVPVYEDFCWMTLGQIKELMQHDNLVNMDTRTVISGIDFTQYQAEVSLATMSPLGQSMMTSAQRKDGLHTLPEILSWLTNLKASYDLSVSRVPLNAISDWYIADHEIARHDGKYFRVMGVRVSIDNREVRSWCQPLVQPMQQGLCAFVVKQINGVLHFLVQAKLECGNLDVFELAPTVQCLTGNIFNAAIKPPFTDYVLNAKPEQVIFDTLQSEEGGRFYHEQNRNMLIVADDDFPMELPATYQWLTLGQINDFLRYNNYLNIQARSLIAAIKYI
jgi:oxidase EvaA